MRICKTLGEDLQGFVRLWERIHKYSRDFGRGFTRRICRGFARNCKTLERICKDLQDFGGGFVRVREHLGEDLQGFTRLWGRICKNL